MSGVIKGMVLGAGGALGLCSQTETLNDVPRTLLKLGLNGYDKISVKHSNHDNISQSGGNEDIQRLAKEISELRIQQNNNQSRSVIVYGNNGYPVYKVLIAGGTVVIVMYYFGYGFSDLMYVTKSTLSVAVKTLEEKLGVVGNKLEEVKNELLSKISSVETTLFESNQSLEQKIMESSADIKLDLNQLNDKFIEIEKTQRKIESTTDKLDSHMFLLQSKFDNNTFDLKRANNGIELLVNSVVDLPHVNKGLLNDLKGYLQNGREKLVQYSGIGRNGGGVLKRGMSSNESPVSGFLGFTTPQNEKQKLKN